MQSSEISNNVEKSSCQKKPPKIDDIIDEQTAENLQKIFLAEQNEDLEEIPAEMLLESYMMSQSKEDKSDVPVGNTQTTNEEKVEIIPQTAAKTTTQSNEDYLLAMQLQFEAEEGIIEEEVIEEGHEHYNNKKTNLPMANTTARGGASNKKTRNTNSRKRGNKHKVRIMPSYYHENNEEPEDNSFTNALTSNDDHIKVRQDSFGNKMAISGTINKHNFAEWSTKHVDRLHEYNANLGGESAFQNVNLGNKAYNSFRRDLEKKGFKKFDQPAPVDKR